MVRRETLTVRHEVHGGKGDVYMYGVLMPEEMMGHGTLYSRVVLPPGSSIGYHTHTGNTEPYYTLQGEGIFTGPDGTKTEVKAGDVCLIACGESHGIENTGSDNLEMMALILNEA